MMTARFSQTGGKVQQNLVLIAISIMDARELSCAAYDCTDSLVGRPNLIDEFACTRHLFVSFTKEDSIVATSRVKMVATALSTSIQEDVNLIRSKSKGEESPAASSSITLTHVIPFAAGQMRLAIDGTEAFHVPDLTSYSFASINLTVREATNNLLVVAHGFRRNLVQEPERWFRREIVNDAELDFEIVR